MIEAGPIVSRLDELIIAGEDVLAGYASPGNIDQHDLWFTRVKSFFAATAPSFLEPLHAATERVITLYGGIIQNGRQSYELIAAQLEVVRAARGHFQRQLDQIAVGGTQSAAIRQLEEAIGKIQKQHSRCFLEEAVRCVRANAMQAAAVFAWVGAVGLLYDFVIANRLADFNREALRRDAKWRIAVTADDLARMKEHDFLDVLEALSIIGKNVKQELQNCLKLRNACGHPNSLTVGPQRVAAHIEVLAFNVYDRF